MSSHALDGNDLLVDEVANVMVTNINVLGALMCHVMFAPQHCCSVVAEDVGGRCRGEGDGVSVGEEDTVVKSFACGFRNGDILGLSGALGDNTLKL